MPPENTLTNQFRGFWQQCQGKLGAAEIGFYMLLVSIWNEAGRPEWITVAYSDIQRAIKVGSHHTLVKWRDALAACGLIEVFPQDKPKPLKIKITSLHRAENALSIGQKMPINRAENALSIGQKMPINRAENALSIGQKMPINRAENALLTAREALPGGRCAPPTERESIESITEIIERGKDSILQLDTDAPPGQSAPSLPLPQKILNLYQEQIRPICSRDEQADLQALCEEYGTKRIEVAINKAAERGKRSLAYVRGILNNWSDADDKQQQRPSKTSRKVRQPTAEEERAKWNAEAERVARYESESGQSSSRRD